MSRARLTPQVLVAAIAAIGCVFCATPAAAHHDDSVVGEYIVVLNDWVEDPEAVAESQVELYGGTNMRYFSSIRGYAANLTWGAVKALREDPTVEYVGPEYAGPAATIERQWVSDLTETDATLNAEIDGQDLSTHYELQIDTTGRFRFDQTTGCPIGHSQMPCTQAEVSGDPLAPGLVQPPEFSLGESHDSQHVSVNMASIGATLTPNTTYFFRAIAANGAAITFGPTQIFTTPGPVVATAPALALAPADRRGAHTFAKKVRRCARQARRGARHDRTRESKARIRKRCARRVRNSTRV